MTKRRIDEIFESKTSTLVPLLDRKPKQDDLPEMVNVVSTVELFQRENLPQDIFYMFPLEAIATQIGANVQYGPLKFAANILRIRDGNNDSTALIFRSGKITAVHCLSWEHARFCCHMYRLMLENIQCVMKDPETGKLQLTNLVGRTQFNLWQVHNSVGFGKLGCRIDLSALLHAAPNVCQYKPDVFPGLKLRAWVKPQEKCTHENSSLKCPCKVKLLIFDSGNVIITGAKSVEDVNQVFYRFKRIVSKYEDSSAELPKHMRREYRLAQLLEAEGVGVKKEYDEREEVKDVLSIMDSVKRQKKQPTDNSPFITACLTGQENNVRWMLNMNETHIQETNGSGKTALELLYEVEKKNDQHKRIINLLEHFK